MVVVQEAFDVPTDIMAKLATGEYEKNAACTLHGSLLFRSVRLW